MRNKIVAGNWKMNKNLSEGIALAKELKEKLESKPNNNVNVIINTPFIHLTEVVSVTKNTRIQVGAQNCSYEAKGAYTGEVSAEMLNSIGCKYVIIGHSERRAYFKETNEDLLKKVNLCLENNLIPIFCCGELLEERDSSIHFKVVERQISETIFKLSPDNFSKIIIAYEPVWAIGTGRTATSHQAQEMHAYIRKIMTEKFGKNISESISLLYGGSCNAQNAKELFSNQDVDGGLIGGASLKADDFINIIYSF